MKLQHEARGRYLLVRAEGKLDASWAEFFAETLLGYIRNGRHQLVVDASGMTFLSSAGIRSLLHIYKALNNVHGEFRLIHPTPFVEQTLRTAGFQVLLQDAPPDMPPFETTAADGASAGEGIERFTLKGNASLTPRCSGGWHPWRKVHRVEASILSFRPETCALGIGSPAEDFQSARENFGEFLAVAGNVVYQPSDQHGHPDYLIAEKEYVPRMQCIQSAGFTGETAFLIRFAPTEKMPFLTVSGLLDHLLALTGGKAVGFVILGEVEGLVGTALIRSPGLLEEDREIPFPEIRDWLSFCGERSYPHQQAILVGLACKDDFSGDRLGLAPMPSRPDIHAHVHAAVFPHQPIQNGRIELGPTVQRLFNGPPPLAAMHLVDDARPAVGLGESALIRGACWFGPLKTPEVVS